MTPERWRAVDELWEAALARPSGERAAFLEGACAGDDALRQEVESLLRHHEQEDGFLGALPAALAAEVVAGRDEWAGRRFGHYQIERRLGQGGMGVVYLARDTRLGRPVALKLLQPRFTRDPERVRRFRREARTASNLNHPNILTIYEVGQAAPEDGGAHFIAAEFISGETLRARISCEPRPDEALDWAIQIAAALAAAHEAGVVHRDIKPENVMARPDGLVKVLDFGLAKLSRATSDPHHTAASHSAGETRQGIVLGTVNYMSPEQARGEQVDARTDIFALGVMLYEMVAGQRPFTGPTDSHVLVAIQEREPPPLAPAGLQRVVGRALAKDCAGRFQTAEEMRLALKGLKRELTADAPARTTSSIPLLISRLIRSPFRGTVALAMLVLVGAGVIIGWQWLASRGAPVNSISAPINSIAVLPFVNVANDPQMEYLPDGITESLIGSLSQLPDLRVMARGAVFSFKGREVDPRQVGEALKVRAVVSGRVLRQGERLVIRVELADTVDGAQLWSDEYQRPVSDILVTQEEIAREISTRLRLRLRGGDQQVLSKRYTDNTDAYQLYLQGRYFYNQFTRASQEKARDYFEQAIARDPRYAMAYTGIADVYAEFSGQYLPPAVAMRKAKQAALTALDLNETLPEAHYSLGLVRWWGDWDWAGAEREFQRAVALNPNFADAIAQYADLLSLRGRFDEALRAARRAAELDPVSAHALNKISNVYYYARHYDQMIEQDRKTLDLNPSGMWVSWAYANLGRALAQKKMHREAIAELEHAVALNRHDASLSWLGYAYGAAGRSADARHVLQEMEGQAARRRVSPVYIARVYVGLKDHERAFAWLRKGYDERSDHLLSLGADPIYDGLRADPRFIVMLRGIGLQQ